MAEIIRMPRLSDTMEEGIIIGWLKNVGDQVSPGDVLAEVETDKATMELESFQKGYLLYIGVKEGAVPVDGIIAVIGDKDEDFSKELEEAQNSTITTQNENKQLSQSDTDNGSINTIEQQNVEITIDNFTTNSRKRIIASPLAKSMALESNLDLSIITGTGDGGRIIKRDIESVLKNKSSNVNLSINNFGDINQDTNYGSISVTQMRKVIAKRLSQSKFSAPHFYLTVEVEMDNAIAARQMLKADDIKVSFNDIVIKACSIALRKHPMINSSWNGETIEVHKDINIGVAVAVDDGLLVPVIKNADVKPMMYINQEVKTLADKAKNKKLQVEEMNGNTFTISNLGMFGIEEFTAIINGPDVCILAVGAIVEKPIVRNGQITVGNTMKLTLSCDHRVVDGATGAVFLTSVKAMLENPIRMLA